MLKKRLCISSMKNETNYNLSKISFQASGSVRNSSFNKYSRTIHNNSSISNDPVSYKNNMRKIFNSNKYMNRTMRIISRRSVINNDLKSKLKLNIDHKNLTNNKLVYENTKEKSNLGKQLINFQKKLKKRSTLYSIII